MTKISVRHSVAQAYGLLFGRPLTVIGLTWLPAVFYAVGADFLIHRMNAAMAVAVPSASGLFGQYAFFYFAALVVATAFFGSVIAVPLTRQAFGMREEQVAVHLVVGAREFRLFFAFLRYYAIAVTTLAALAIGAGVAITQGTHYAAAHGFPAIWHGYPLETWFNSIAAAVTVIVFSVLAVRYGFFLDAIAALEDRARLARAASLSRGNFWAIATTLLVVTVPAGLVLLACEMTFGGLNLAVLGLPAADATPFAAILAAGLVVIHTLTAGASAGAYAEMAEALVQENELYQAPPDLSPAAVFAHAPAAAEVAYQAAPAEMTAAPAIAITLPEAEHGVAAPELDAPGAWMAPPPDAHFGSDPHDAQPHQGQSVQLHEEPQLEPLAAAVAAAEATAHPVEAQNASMDTLPDVHPAASSAEPIEVEVVQAKQVEQAMAEYAIHDYTGAEIGAQPETSAAATQIVGFDGHPAEVPEHAHNAEFPPPPLDPAGVMSAQQGFHSPG
jgi:hypothetical protein